MPLVREYEETSVVIKCPAPPLLITPTWLFRHDIIDEDQYAARDRELVAIGPAARFTLDWLTVTVTHDTLQLTTTRPEQTSPLRDVATGTLRSLEGVPVWSMGLNRSTHFSVGGRAGADRVGDALAPKDVWGTALHLPGMLSLLITAPREGLASGRTNVRTEPSSAIKDGIFVEVNDHFDLVDLPEPITARDQVLTPHPELDDAAAYDLGLQKRSVALELLEQEWNPADRRAAALFAQVHSLSVGMR